MTEFAGEETSSPRGSPKGRYPQIGRAAIAAGGYSVESAFPGAAVDRRNPG
jgi:hypothetical protein